MGQLVETIKLTWGILTILGVLVIMFIWDVISDRCKKRKEAKKFLNDIEVIKKL